jgi:[ribosomal protein S5]-alanine N-acetyltransferase
MLEPNFTPFPELHTNRLHLRQKRESDAKEILFLRSDPRVMKYINKERAASIDDALAFIRRINELEKNNEGITWGITLKEGGPVIGSICIWNIQKQHYRAEIGYALHPDMHRKGYMQEAIVAVIDFGFNTMKLHSMEGCVNPENEASIRILEKNGFVREGYFRQDFFYDGKFYDSGVYSLLRSEYVPR